MLFLEYIYKIDTHAHTKENSPCGKISARALVGLYKKYGYSGVNITDHFAYYIIDENADPDKEVERFYRGSQIAAEEGEKLGINIYHGVEYRLESEYSRNEYLLFGTTREFLKKSIRYFHRTYRDFYDFAKSEGVLVFQAHPFRDGMTPTPDCCDGAEVFNAHPGHDSRNDRAFGYAKSFGLRMLAGSDCHDIGHAGRSGILSKYIPQNDIEFYELIKSEDYKLIICEN